MKHRHEAEHVHRCDGGVVYEVCRCGAVRKLVHGRGEWHACRLCSTEVA